MMLGSHSGGFSFASIMEQPNKLSRSAVPYFDGRSRSSWGRLGDFWFAPKRFESKALYERLGVLLVKRYAPTGGDFVNRHFGITIVDLHGNVDSLIRFERLTRVWEAVHGIAFLGFFTFSLRRAVTRRTSWLDFGFAIVVYLSLILSPALLQRYNRLRVYAVIRRMAAKQQARGRTSVPIAEMRMEG